MKKEKKTNKKFHIGIDMDGILASFHQAWLDWYNKKWDDNLTPLDLVWDLQTIVKPECGSQIFNFLQKKNIYKHIEPLPGAMKALHTLVNQGHDIVIITQAAGGVGTVPDKQEWLDRYLPHKISRDNIMYTSRKELVKFDIFIDDSPSNIIHYRNAWPYSQILTIAWPHNIEVKNLVNLYANGFDKTKDAWKEIVNYIETISEEPTKDGELSCQPCKFNENCPGFKFCPYLMLRDHRS